MAALPAVAHDEEKSKQCIIEKLHFETETSTPASDSVVTVTEEAMKKFARFQKGRMQLGSDARTAGRHTVPG